MTLEQTNRERPSPKQIAEWLYSFADLLDAEASRYNALSELLPEESSDGGRIKNEAEKVRREANTIWEEH